MTRKTVLLLFGGESSEHEVSLKSAKNVYAALDDTKYDVLLCFIDKVGRWWLVENIDGAHLGHPQLLPKLGQHAFEISPSGNTLTPDVIFPVLHGAHGEDGTVQSLAKLLHVPVVGPSALGAAITMNKDVTKRLLRDAAIPVVPWRAIQADEKLPAFDEIVQELGETVFIKPASAGSSVGVHKVTTPSEFRVATKDAFSHSDTILVETAIESREVELAVLGNNSPKVSGVGEIVSGDTFYSYDDKYATESTAQVVIPAQLDKEIVSTLQAYALSAYSSTDGHGMARVDFFIDKHSNQIYLNEINSIPGFTDISMYPKLWHEAGLNYSQLIDELIRLALEVGV